MDPDLDPEVATQLLLFAGQTTDFVGVADGGGRVLYVNPAARKVLGVADATNVTLADLFPMEEFAFYYEVVRPQLLRTGAWNGTVRVNVAGEGFRFGRGREGDCDLLRSLGIDAREVPLVAGVSSTRIRAHAAAGEMEAAARLLGRPLEVDGVVVGGDRRGGSLGFPTANLRVEPNLLVPAYGIYAGAVGESRAAVSIGVNPHYGGSERRIEAYLLDWEGDLYGDRLVVELWRRLRDERAFASEAELIAQIARDVEETRAATRP